MRLAKWLVYILFGSSILLAVVTANAHELWCFIARDSDPRMYVGQHALILHNRGGQGHLVIREPGGIYHDFNYRTVVWCARLYVGFSALLVTVVVARRYRERDEALAGRPAAFP